MDLTILLLFGFAAIICGGFAAFFGLGLGLALLESWTVTTTPDGKVVRR